jgi:hypothetical protein
MYRLWIESTVSDFGPVPVAVNSIFDTHLDRFSKQDLDDARATIYKNLIDLNPTGSEPIYVLTISSRHELQRCFPHVSSRRSNVLVEFFSAISFNKTLRRGYDFREKVPVWTVTLVPVDNWPTTLAAIREDLARPGLQERFGLTDEAAKLLEWVENLPDDKKMLNRVTPIVEDAATKFIGIKCPWSQENAPVYLQLLVDEINERTNYNLTVHPWRDFGQVKSRIVIKYKATAIEGVVSQLRQIAALRGKLVDDKQLHAAVQSLIGS